MSRSYKITINNRTYQSVVLRGYTVFGSYELNGKLLVCTCPVCVAPEVKEELIRTPVREISSDLLREYTRSAHGLSPDNELKHFLPRYFELILQGDECSHFGLSFALHRLAYARWFDRWPEPERAIVHDAFSAIAEAALHEDEPLAKEPFVNVLSLISEAGGDLMQTGAAILRVDTKFATRRLAQAIVCAKDNAFAQSSTDGQAWAAFLAWAVSGTAGTRLETAFLEAATDQDETLFCKAINAS